MRCGNCGFVNNDNRKNCEKCGSILADQPPERSYNKANEPVSYGTPTVRGGSSQQPPVPPVINKCPYCNYYPLKYPVSQVHPCVNCKKTGEAVGPSLLPGPNGGTIGITNPEFLGSTEPSTLILTNTQTGKSMAFKGDNQLIKRDMLNPDDMGLSSNGHVQFTKDKNGEWYISDISSNKATFIQVQGKMPIQPDTVVLLGRNFYKITFE